MSNDKTVEEIRKAITQCQNIKTTTESPWVADEADLRSHTLEDVYNYFMGKTQSINHNSLLCLRSSEEIYEMLVDYRDRIDITIEATREGAYDPKVTLINGVISQDRRAELLMLSDFCTKLIDYITKEREHIK